MTELGMTPPSLPFPLKYEGDGGLRLSGSFADAQDDARGEVRMTRGAPDGTGIKKAHKLLTDEELCATIKAQQGLALQSGQLRVTEKQ